jgi:hypothetical protein
MVCLCYNEIKEIKMSDKKSIIRKGDDKKPTVSIVKKHIRVTKPKPKKSELQKWLDKDIKDAKKLLK